MIQTSSLSAHAGGARARSLHALLAACAMTLLGASVAQAGGGPTPPPDPTPFFAWTGCGGTVFNTCVKVEITKVNVTLVAADGPRDYIKLSVQNLGSLGATSYASVFTALGMRNIPYSLTGLAKVVGVGSGWTFSTGINELSNFGKGFQGVNINGNTGTTPGSSTTFYFTFANLAPVTTCDSHGRNCVTTTPALPAYWTAGAPMEFALHGQVGPNGCSTKLDVQKTGAIYGATTVTTPTGINDAICGGSTTITPEPAALLLVATGLMGIGMVGVVKRRT